MQYSYFITKIIIYNLKLFFINNLKNYMKIKFDKYILIRIKYKIKLKLKLKHNIYLIYKIFIEQNQKWK